MPTSATGHQPRREVVVYGGLQVTVPADWRVATPLINAGCLQSYIGPNTVQPVAYRELVSASCPSAAINQLPSSYVTIDCSYGVAVTNANPTGTSTTVFGDKTLIWDHPRPGYYDAAMKTGSDLSAASVDEPLQPSLADAIFKSIRPSRSRC